MTMPTISTMAMMASISRRGSSASGDSRSATIIGSWAMLISQDATLAAAIRNITTAVERAACTST